MNFAIPRGDVLPVHRIDVRLDTGPHPFVLKHEAAIVENWKRETDANPAVFDGEVALLASLAYADGVLSGHAHIVRYSAFLLWRRMRPIPSAEHCFAHAVPVGSDGALLAIRMASHTVNAGDVYFAAGSFEPVDFRDAQVDVPFNMRREVGEETGIDLDEGEAEPSYHCWSGPNGTVIFRRYRFRETAEALAERVEAFIATESEPEIAGAVVIRTPDSVGERLKPHMPPILAWHFANP